MRLSTNIAGIELKNPLLPASGPLVGDAAKLRYIAALGVGGLVTKTISTQAAQVQRPCIYGERDLIMNNELWSEYPPEQWLTEILPELETDLTIPLIVSVGYSQTDMETLIPLLDPLAAAFEVSTHYVGNDVAAMAATVRTIRAYTDKPFFMKISPHLPDPAGFARMVKANGGNGVVAINSLGPTMKVDLAGRRVLLGNPAGHVWTSGPAIKPLALALVHQIKEAEPDLTVIGVGGVKTAADVLEFLLAGADAVQMLSAALLYGKDLYRRLVDDLPKALDEYGFDSVAQVIAARLTRRKPQYEPAVPVVEAGRCSGCRLCEKVCPYFAIRYEGRVVVDPGQCFGCGLCESRCPAGAISGVFG